MSEKLVDNVFGELEFDYDWVKDSKQKIFGREFDIDIIVEGNDENNSIREEQRESFKKFQVNNSEIIKRVELVVFEYDQTVRKEQSMIEIKFSEVSDKIILSGIIFPVVLEDGELSIGFLFESDSEPEHGIGIKITDEEIEVGNQDILI